MRRVMAPRVFAGRVWRTWALGGYEAATPGTVSTFCVEARGVYQPGSDAWQVYGPGSSASQVYAPGSDAVQVGCCS